MKQFRCCWANPRQPSDRKPVFYFLLLLASYFRKLSTSACSVRYLRLFTRCPQKEAFAIKSADHDFLRGCYKLGELLCLADLWSLGSSGCTENAHETNRVARLHEKPFHQPRYAIGLVGIFCAAGAAE